MLSPEVVAEARRRIAPYINQTPLLRSSLLDRWMQHEFLFKVEGFQKAGAFKVRGALNALVALKQRGVLPREIVAFSSGNHAQAVAYAARQLDVRATVLLPADASSIKRQASAAYGAEVIDTRTRAEAEAKSEALRSRGAYLLHPFDDDDVIAGQGTACFEALQAGVRPDAIFATCGGGGWASGTYLAAELLAPGTPVYAAEPATAADAARSYRGGRIVRLHAAPRTIADGARTLSVAERTFQYLQRLAGFFEIEEDDIVYWTQWLTHLLKTTVEPTSAVAMAGAAEWARSQPAPRRILVMLSGGNVAPETHAQIWARNALSTTPDRRP